MQAALGCAMAIAAALPAIARSDEPATIERIKPSIVAVGTFERLRSP
jgi:hypothetical protein